MVTNKAHLACATSRAAFRWRCHLRPPLSRLPSWLCHVPYPQANPIESDRSLLLKEGFQLLWALAMHSPLSLRDMARGAGMYNTLVRHIIHTCTRFIFSLGISYQLRGFFMKKITEC